MAELIEVRSDEIRSVTITVEEYKGLVEKACKHDLLVDALLDETILDYSKKKLSIYTDAYNTLLRTFEHDAYTARLHELQEMKKEEE